MLLEGTEAGKQILGAKTAIWEHMWLSRGSRAAALNKRGPRIWCEASDLAILGGLFLVQGSSLSKRHGPFGPSDYSFLSLIPH